VRRLHFWLTGAIAAFSRSRLQGQDQRWCVSAADSRDAGAATGSRQSPWLRQDEGPRGS